MKKFYFFLLLSFCVKTISAQTYYPLLDSTVNHWQIIANIIPVRLQAPNTTSAPCTYPLNYIHTLEEYTMQDTVINSLTYKIVDAVEDQNPTPCHFGYVREDTAAKKVYFLDNLGNPEILLYDFSMQVGNTIAINFLTGYFFQSGTFTLDSIKTIHVNSGFRRIFFLNNHAFPGSQTLPWVESIGSLYSPFYPYFSNDYGANQFYTCSDFNHEALEFLSCFDHVSKIYYDSCAYHLAIMNSCFDVQDTCNYYDICGSVNELSSLASISVFPNPSNGKFTLNIELKQKDNLEIIVRDISGKKIMQEIPVGKVEAGKKDIELNLSGFSNGFYLIECKGESGSVYEKILIQH